MRSWRMAGRRPNARLQRPIRVKNAGGADMLWVRAAMVFLAAAVSGLAAGGRAWGAYTPVEVKDGGCVSGTVKWSGDIPAEKTIKPGVDTKVCHVRPDQALVIDKKTLGVKNAVVYLSGIKKGKKFASRRVTLGQKDCIYTPRVIVVPAKGEVGLQSSDVVTHNIHIYTRRNRAFNLILPPRPKESDTTEPVVRRFVRPDRILAKCDIHSWMKAHILVSSHPYRVVTDERGQFSITDIPSGTYRIGVWHEQGYSSTRTEGVPVIEFARKIQDVTVEKGKTTTVDFTAALKEESAK